MTMAAIALSALLLCQGADDPKLGDLIRDLGAEAYSTRERAESELRKRGETAIPALREALKDKDPERSFRAHRVLEAVEKTAPRAAVRAWTAHRDFARGFTFEKHPDGSVELTVRESEGESCGKDLRTYRADSLEEFKKKYPDVASKYDVDALLPRERWSLFDDTKERSVLDWFWDKDAVGAPPLFPLLPNSIGKWMLQAGKAVKDRPQLGVAVERVGSALADQLGLGADEGVVVADVKPSSPAEKAGLRRHDLLLKVNGKSIGGPQDLRREVSAGVRNGMELEILRRGKRETLKVDPVTSPESN